MTGVVSEFPESQIANLRSDQVKDNTSAIVTMPTVLKYLQQCKYGWRVEPRPKVGTIIKSGVSSTEAKPDDLKILELIDSQKTFEPDITVESIEAKHLLPVEMKPPGSFSMDGIEAGDLVQAYSKKSQECNQNQDNALEVSEAVSFTSSGPTLLDGLFYIIVQSMTAMENGQQFNFDKGTRDGKEDAEERTVFQKGRIRKIRTTVKGSQREIRIAKLCGEELKSLNRILHLRTIVICNTRSLQTCIWRKCLTPVPGWSGNVGLGCINDQPVAIKFAFIDTPKAEALFMEITAYKILQRYWGTYVAELVKYGTTVDGKVVFVATKFIEGSEMWRRALSEVEWRAAEEALDAIHSCGLLHGDVHGGNILFTEGQALFIDFGFSKAITEKADCAKGA